MSGAARPRDYPKSIILFTLKMVVTAPEQAEVLKIARSLINPTRVETGCMDCNVYRDLEDSDQIVFIEQWESEADLKRHISSTDYRKVLALMDLSKRPPQVTFSTVVETRGMDVIEAARKHKENQRE